MRDVNVEKVIEVEKIVEKFYLNYEGCKRGRRQSNKRQDKVVLSEL